MASIVQWIQADLEMSIGGTTERDIQSTSLNFIEWCKDTGFRGEIRFFFRFSPDASSKSKVATVLALDWLSRAVQGETSRELPSPRWMVLRSKWSIDRVHLNEQPRREMGFVGGSADYVLVI